MSFNSIGYALFLPIVFLIYWYCLGSNLKRQNLFLLVVSYVYYAFWDWKCLFLLIAITLSTYSTALAAVRLKDGNYRYLWTAVNVVVCLSVLAVFKYFNFFGEGLSRLFGIFGITLDWVTIDILLPIGISFYTFQSLSYSIDVYKRKIEPTSDVVGFATYVAFFPQLAIGPIERSTQLLPQILSPRRWDYYSAVLGMRQILWGLLKKVAVADVCGVYVDRVFTAPDYYSGSTLLLASVMFSFQIYADFSGYSDIARGTAKLFGVNLMENFHYPYFATSIASYWRRWHISLMTWLRDYVYIPLGGSRRGKLRTIANVGVVFILSGLWHGQWNYLLWGVYWAVVMTLCQIFKVGLSKENRIVQLYDLPKILAVFSVVILSRIVLKCESWAVFKLVIDKIFSMSVFEIPTGRTPLIPIIFMLIIEWCGRKNPFPLKNISKSVVIRWGVYWLFLIIILLATEYESNGFIYFKF